MTGYTVHTGTSKKFSSGWDRIFNSPAKQDDTAKAETKKPKTPKKKPAKPPQAESKSKKQKVGKTAKKK